ncbi:MAG: energy transducer TonB [Thermoflexibacteraceae bacterium]|jgi:protein TonB
MKNVQNSFEDIVFENLNKSYGAYEIRKLYPRNLSRALWSSAVFATALLVAPVMYQKLFSKDIEVVTLYDKAHELVQPPPVDPKQPEVKLPALPPPPAVPQEVASQRFLEIEPTDDQDANIEEPPTQEQLATVQISNKTQEGVPDDGTADLNIEVGTDNRISEVIDVVKENEPAIFVEQMPVFQGGMTELQKFLSRNLRYPKSAQLSNIAGTVYVQFVVNTDGSIVDAKVLKGIGYGCDEEAIRVVSMMPKWNAGKQAGKAVRVRFNLPIKFVLATD